MKLKELFFLVTLSIALLYMSATHALLFDHGTEFVGQVKSYSYSQNVVKIHIANHKESHIFKICNYDNSAYRPRHVKREYMDTIRLAMKEDKTVKLMYGSLFSSCIRGLSLVN